MSQSARERWMLEILRRAVDHGPPPTTGHLVGDGWEDDERLACWEEGLLSASQHAEIIDHLAQCPTCRRSIAEMIRTGRLTLKSTAADPGQSPEPNWNAVGQGVQPRALPGESVWDVAGPPVVVPRVAWWRSRQFYGVALAVCVLIGLTSVFWTYSPGGSDRVLALAERQLRSGQAAEAMQSLEPLFGKSLPAGLEGNAKALFAEAGGQVAAEKLAQKDFRGVVELEQRVARQAGASGELSNLRLQAERGIPSRVALDRMGTLIDYGYELDGSSPRKALPILDETTKRLAKEYQAALTAHPKNLDLLLNRGQFLLSQSRLDDARRCFAEARAAFPNSAGAEVGLGLIEFDAGHTPEALNHFQAALKADPQNFCAQVNAGICLYSLGHKAEARGLWQQALQQAKDPALVERLKAQLRQP
jgi:tetratricopeptide (TPR) repeat protein